MRPLIAALVSSAVLATPFAAGAQQGGLSPAQLQAAGWTCFNVPSLGVHCVPPGKSFPPTEPNSQVLFFFNTTDPSSTVPDFTGTESLFRDDIFRGQPCPTEGGFFTLLAALGLGGVDYWACHRDNGKKR